MPAMLRAVGEAFAPEILLGLLFYGYASGCSVRESSRRRPTRAFHFGSLLAARIRIMTHCPLSEDILDEIQELLYKFCSWRKRRE